MSVSAVVVSYQPTSELIANVAAMLDQVDEIVIVDNGSGAGAKELLERLGSYPKVTVIYNQDNLGIAAALNIGVRHAKAAGHEWVATFDQDSKVSPGMTKKMLQAYDGYPQKEKVASLSPRYKHKKTGEFYGNKHHSPGDVELPYAEVREVMSSGNLVKSSTFDKVGYFNEDLFIDHVDNEFCLRCTAAGYKILEIKDAILLHSIGQSTQHKFLWKTLFTTNHSALRRYYIARNSIYVYKTFILTQPMWVLRNAYGLIKMITVSLLFESNRRKILAANIRGVIDGLSGKMGKFEETSQDTKHLPDIPRG